MNDGYYLKAYAVALSQNATEKTCWSGSEPGYTRKAKTQTEDRAGRKRQEDMEGPGIGGKRQGMHGGTSQP